MKVGILAGGYGSRLSEETVSKPKPMVEIGNHPILWHIMQHYAHFGFDDFVVALGYRGDYIKKYMIDFASISADDLTIDLATGRVERNCNGAGDGRGHARWKVALVDTGLKTQTGGRIKRLAPHLGDATFMLTWGDGVSNVDLDALLAFHRRHGRIATVTAVRPPARFGRLDLDERDQVVRFAEKPVMGEGWINGAFFVLEPAVFDYIADDRTHFEKEPLEALAREGQLMAYRHDGYWQCMDTLRDKVLLETLWESGEAPWKLWS